MARVPRGTPLSPDSYPKLREAYDWFIANGVDSSLMDCMIGANVTRDCAQDARAVLKAEGIITGDLPRTPTKYRYEKGADPAQDSDESRRPNSRKSAPDLSPEYIDKILTDVLDGKVIELTADQNRAFLSEIARTAPNHGTKITALKALNDLQKQNSTAADLGPGPPLTLDDRLFHASLILSACTREHAPEVWRRAFHEVITNVEAEQGPESDEGVQEGRTPLGLEVRSEGDVPEAGGSDRPVGAAQAAG